MVCFAALIRLNELIRVKRLSEFGFSLKRITAYKPAFGD
jgi:hypothetical protein